LDKERVMQALEILKDQPRGEDRILEIADDYKTVNVSEKVLRIILSHINYVNQRIWNKLT